MPAELWTLEQDGYWRSEYRDAYSARDNFEYGTYRPSASTTGILVDRSELTVHNGNLSTVANNQVIENLWIKGRLQIKHSGVVIRNCLFTGDTAGPSSPAYAALWSLSPQAVPATISDCTFEAAVATVYSGNAIQGQDMNIYRCNLSGFVDGIGVQARNVTVAGCWIHDMPWYAWSPSHSDGTHNDGIQVHGGDNFDIVGNSIEVGYHGNAAIQVTQDAYATSDLLIDRNWFMSTHATRTDACTTGLNVSSAGSGGGGAPMSDLTITGNRFTALTSWRVNHAGLVSATTFDAATISGNVYDDTELTAKITRST